MQIYELCMSAVDYRKILPRANLFLWGMRQPAAGQCCVVGGGGRPTDAHASQRAHCCSRAANEWTAPPMAYHRASASSRAFRNSYSSRSSTSHGVLNHAN